jgi:glucosylceramidase
MVDVSSEIRDSDLKLPEVLIDPARKQQRFLGFGGAFTESSCYVLSLMSPEERRGVLADYFSPEGLRYALGRLAINSCDFSLGSYDYLTPKDETLKTFSVAREDRYVVPAIREATLAHGSPLLWVASPWSPCAFMKDNGSMLQGGHLLSADYPLWARYECLYLLAMRKRGINVAFVTLQNEPQAAQVWESCLYSPEEEGGYALVLREALDKNGLQDVKILIWDHNLDILPERVAATFGIKGVKAAVAGVAFHWYGPEAFANLAKCRAAYPDKEFLFTEGCVEGLNHPFGEGAFASAERYARNIIGDLAHGAEGWIDWNLVLDEKGGPNHAGNDCEALIQYDSEKKRLVHNPSFYGMAQFARFIAPGADILSSAEVPGLKVVSAQNPDGSLVAVCLNEGSVNLKASYRLGPTAFSYETPAHTLTTFSEAK